MGTVTDAKRIANQYTSALAEVELVYCYRWPLFVGRWSLVVGRWLLLVVPA